MSATPILSARELRLVRGGRTLLDVDSFSLAEGETLALIGPNGAGKSTLLNCLATLAVPDRGTLSLRGETISGRAKALAYRRKVSAVFQEPLLLDMTVEENVGLGLKLRGVAGAKASGAVAAAMERFSINHLRGRNALTLSGGEAQRASLARAFAVEPEVIFLDEPFSALDPPTREALMADLGRTLREGKTSSVFVTHDRSEALYLADRLAVMREGAIVQEGAPWEVMNSPADEATAAFVGMETLLKGLVAGSEGGLVTVRLGETRFEAVGALEPGTPVVLGIRPENVTLGVEDLAPHTSARNRFVCEVRALLPAGPLVRVDLDCGFLLRALVTARSAQELGLKPGVRTLASVKASAVHLMAAKG